MSAELRGGMGWAGVVRVGLVQASIGAVVVLMTATLNRVMVVELGLPAAVPGALVALHFAVQLVLRPQMGHASDRTGRRTPWIVGGMVLLAAAGVGAAASTALVAANRAFGLALAVVSFAALGAGVSAAGTPLLALVAESVAPGRRARAAAVVWVMMIAGFVVTTVGASLLLTPFTFDRLVRAVGIVAAAAVLVAVLASWGLEAPRGARGAAGAAPAARFGDAVRRVWADPAARAFAIFVFVSMLAYSAQDLILEPFAGAVFGLSPAQSTRISGLHQVGMLAGMLGAALLASRIGTLRGWAAGGCAASGAAFVLLALTPAFASLALLKAVLFTLGVANGTFAVGAVASMMAVSVSERNADAGVRMGVFGAAQAIAYAFGGFAGAVGSDVARAALGSSTGGYVTVFAAESVLFVLAAGFAGRSAGAGRAAAMLREPDGATLLAQLG